MHGSAPHVVPLISAHYPQLSGALRRVADFIMDNPHQAALMTLDDFARDTGVSAATANRLGRKLGLSVGRKPSFVLSGCGPAGLSVVEALIRATAATIGSDAAERRSRRLTASLGDVLLKT